jgi:hypothetical protein
MAQAVRITALGTFVIQVVCVLLNIPGMIEGRWYSFMAFGFCLGLLFSTTLCNVFMGRWPSTER